MVGSKARFESSTGGRIDIGDDEVHLNGDSEPAVLGDTLQQTLDQLCTIMTGMAGAIPAGAGAPFVPQIAAVKAALSSIKSASVKLA